MKAVFITIGIGVLAFIAIQVLAKRGQNGIETYPYEVVKNYDDFEIREYEASLFSSVKLVSKSYKNGSNEGFRKLAGYIFGGNDKEEKIAMTSPVAMSLDDTMTMMFMVPRNLKKENLPTPNNSEIQFEEVPAKKVAAIRFSGWASDKKIEKYKKQLITALEKKGIEFTNRFYYLGYNPPYEAVNRRNEVIVELK
jgi:hypothetical protein